MNEFLIGALAGSIVALMYGHFVIIKALSAHQRAIIGVQKAVIRLNEKEIARNEAIFRASMTEAQAEERFLG